MSADYRNFQTYLTEDHHTRPKEYFLKLARLLEEYRAKLPAKARVLDIGCATGGLIGFLAERFPDWSYHGVDISDELLMVARRSVPNAEFSTGSALELNPDLKGKFDVVLCLGVIGIFGAGDARRCLINMIDAAAPGGLVYAFGQFNDFDVDVQVTHRKRVDGKLGSWEAGWSNHSRTTVSEWLAGRARSIRFVDFEMPFALTPRADPVRSWTIESGGRLRLTNGLKLLIDLSFLEITA